MTQEEFDERLKHPLFKGKPPCKECGIFPQYQNELCPSCEIEVESKKAINKYKSI